MNASRGPRGRPTSSVRAARPRGWVLQYPAGRRGAPSPVAVGRQLAGIFALRGLAVTREARERDCGGRHVATGGAASDRRATAWGVAADEPRLTVRFVDAHESAALNRTFRGRPNATNVLSFPSGEPAAEADGEVDAVSVPAVAAVNPAEGGLGRRLPWYLGDLVLCTDVLRTEARAQGKSLLQHATHLLVHGVLHLEGFDHLDDAQAQVMENEERRILGALGWPDPYAPAVSACDPDPVSTTRLAQPRSVDEAAPSPGARAVGATS